MSKDCVLCHGLKDDFQNIEEQYPELRSHVTLYIRVKMEDAIVTSMALYNDGLEPSNKENTNRLMKKYLEIMRDCADKADLPKEVLRKTLHQYELLEYGSNEGIFTQKIMSFVYPQTQTQKTNTIEEQQTKNSFNLILADVLKNRHVR
ncbi:MAG: hypothetical protein IJ660_06500 [Alphaproteobacteria bacterium]|nr:hypothetical protein [Alphaproteobacteria bacterium]